MKSYDRVVRVVLAVLACTGCRQLLGIDEDVPFVDAAPACMFRDVATGMMHTCEIDSVGKLWCWGDNRDGQVQLDGPPFMLDPTSIEPPSRRADQRR